MASVALTLTAAEHQGFQEALGAFSRVPGVRVPPDAEAILAAAGLRPATSLSAGFVHNTLAGSFEDPLPFDPGHQIQYDNPSQGDPRLQASVQGPDRTVAFDLTTNSADSIQFLLFCLAGPYASDSPALQAIRRMADAIAQALPTSASRLGTLATPHTDGTIQHARS